MECRSRKFKFGSMSVFLLWFSKMGSLPDWSLWVTRIDGPILGCEYWLNFCRSDTFFTKPDASLKVVASLVDSESFCVARPLGLFVNLGSDYLFQFTANVWPTDFRDTSKADFDLPLTSFLCLARSLNKADCLASSIKSLGLLTTGATIFIISSPTSGF